MPEAGLEISQVNGEGSKRSQTAKVTGDRSNGGKDKLPWREDLECQKCLIAMGKEKNRQ